MGDGQIEQKSEKKVVQNEKKEISEKCHRDLNSIRTTQDTPAW